MLAALVALCAFDLAQALPRGHHFALARTRTRPLAGTGESAIAPVHALDGTRAAADPAALPSAYRTTAADDPACWIALRGGSSESGEEGDEMATGSQASLAPGVLTSGEAPGETEEEWDTAEAGSTLDGDSFAPASSIKACPPRLLRPRPSRRSQSRCASDMWTPSPRPRPAFLTRSRAMPLQVVQHKAAFGIPVPSAFMGTLVNMGITAMMGLALGSPAHHPPPGACSGRAPPHCTLTAPAAQPSCARGTRPAVPRRRAPRSRRRPAARAPRRRAARAPRVTRARPGSGRHAVGRGARVRRAGRGRRRAAPRPHPAAPPRRR